MSPDLSGLADRCTFEGLGYLLTLNGRSHQTRGAAVPIEPSLRRKSPQDLLALRCKFIKTRTTARWPVGRRSQVRLGLGGSYREVAFCI